MVDDVGFVCREHALKATAVPDGADPYHQIQTGESGAQLLLNLVSVVFVNIENDQLFGVVRGDLAAQLAADGTAATGNEDRFADDMAADLGHIDLNGGSAQQIFHGHVLHIADADLSCDDLGDAGQDLQLTAGLFADIQDTMQLFLAGAGDGNEDLVDAVLLYIGQDSVPAAHHRHARDIPVPFVGVIVNEAADLQIIFGLLGDVLQDHLSGTAGADEHDPLAVAGGPELAALQQDEAVGEPDTQHGGKLQTHAYHKIGNRHAAEQDRDADDVQKRCDQRGGKDTHQLIDAGEAPDAVVQPHPDEDHDADHGVDRQEFEAGRQIVFGDRGINAIESEKERQQIRRVDGDHVKHDQQRGDHMPMLKSSLWFVLLVHNKPPVGAFAQNLRQTILLTTPV